ncbi:STAS domain-containing protein [Zoogloea sp.]|uniref:STAS domain-containing protein n=1 Tax=Zoogloea sp. TaxID=49181 RepID=UPI0035B09D1D
MAFFGKKPESRPAAAPAAPEPAPKGPEVSALDFTLGGDPGRALADAADSMEVQEVGGGLSAAAEEAAVLYANGNFGEAEAVLDGALDAPGTHAGEGLWMMLLDLLRLTGRREAFDARVIEYATRFEKSPPPWIDLSGRTERRGPVGPATVNLVGQLGAQAATQFAQIETIGRKSRAVRLEVGKVKGLDEAGCGLLAQTLFRLRADKVAVTVSGGGALVEHLQGRLKPGEAREEAAWLLLLDLMQEGGTEAAFEEWAVNYAITFEVSPPSWEARAKPTPGGANPAAEVPDDEAASGTSLEGEITGANTEPLRRMAAAAEAAGTLAVECGRLRRMDFVSAGTCFNILAALGARGKLVSLHNVNAMVAALLRVMGVDQVAHIHLRVA